MQLSLPSSTNGLTFNKFIDEFTACLETKILQRGHLLIGGDFNTHVDSPNDCKGQMFSDLLESLGLKQHIVGPTSIIAILSSIGIDAPSHSVPSAIDRSCQLSPKPIDGFSWRLSMAALKLSRHNS